MVLHIPRDDFLSRYWNYQPGEHVLFVEATQQGKTHLAFQLLANSRHPQLRPPVALVMKPRDPTPSEWTERLGFRETAEWPPVRHFWQDEPAGYTLWPKHRLGLDSASLEWTNANLRRQFQRGILDGYRRGNQVILADELYGLLAELKLHEELTAIVTRGSGLKTGLWSATQKPSGTQHGASVPGFFFNSATHLFIGPDADKRNRDRLREIGGIDPDVLSDIVGHLEICTVETPYGPKPVSEKLYIDKRGVPRPYLAVIGV
jgi:hypothetical protein